MKSTTTIKKQCLLKPGKDKEYLGESGWGYWGRKDRYGSLKCGIIEFASCRL